MYRKFREDPSSVDSSWHEFLVDYAPEPVDGSSEPAKSAAPAQTTTKTQTSKTQTSKPAPSSNGSAPTKPAPSTDKPAAKSDTKPAEKPTQKPAEKPAAKPEAKAEPAKPKTPPAAPATDDQTAVLRGAAAAVVKNMNFSLEVPTATSVRAIPAKAMIDNRVVINNHLKRTRGGKISFTHLLGYAIVQAVKSFPNMNRHFAEIDGKRRATHASGSGAGSPCSQSIRSARSAAPKAREPSTTV